VEGGGEAGFVSLFSFGGGGGGGGRRRRRGRRDGGERGEDVDFLVEVRSSSVYPMPEVKNMYTTGMR